MKKELLTRSALVLFGLFGLHMIATKFYWYSIIWWFDMPMHFLGGLWLGIFGVWFYYFIVPKRFVIPMTVNSLILVAITSAFFIGMSWEAFEYFVQWITNGHGLATIIDSISDIFFDIAGGLVAVVYLLVHVSFTEKEKNTV